MAIAANDGLNQKQGKTVSQQLKVLAFTREMSTRIMLDTSISKRHFDLEQCRNTTDFMQNVKNGTHDIYIIDASTGAESTRYELLGRVSDLKKKGTTRVVLLVDEVPPAEANHMESFGPICFLECFFTAGRLNRMLAEVLKIRDTGCRVKGDSKFFDITVLTKKKKS